jgi:hypothetical protein
MIKVDKKKDFILCEIKKIDIDKWLEGCDKDYDPGQDYIFGWIKNNASQYRYDWEISKCSSCSKWYRCGWRALYYCDYHLPE